MDLKCTHDANDASHQSGRINYITKTPKPILFHFVRKKPSRLVVFFQKEVNERARLDTLYGL